MPCQTPQTPPRDIPTIPPQRPRCGPACQASRNRSNVFAICGLRSPLSQQRSIPEKPGAALADDRDWGQFAGGLPQSPLLQRFDLRRPEHPGIFSGATVVRRQELGALASTPAVAEGVAVGRACERVGAEAGFSRGPAGGLADLPSSWGSKTPTSSVTITVVISRFASETPVRERPDGSSQKTTIGNFAGETPKNTAGLQEQQGAHPAVASTFFACQPAHRPPPAKAADPPADLLRRTPPQT